jgi:hypothetical protein
MSRAIIKIERNGAEVVQEVELWAFSASSAGAMSFQVESADINPGDILMSVIKADTAIIYTDRRSKVTDAQKMATGGKTIYARVVRGYDEDQEV